MLVFLWYSLHSCWHSFLGRVYSTSLTRAWQGVVFAWKVMAFGALGLGLPAIALFYLKNNVPFASNLLYLPGTEHDRSMTVLTLQVFAYIGFLMFEMAVGAYFPCMGGIKADLVPENVRTTMYNLFYIPMNLMLCLVLLIHLTGLQIPDEGMLCIAIGILLTACLLVGIFDIRTTRKEEKEEAQKSISGSVREERKSLLA